MKVEMSETAPIVLRHYLTGRPFFLGERADYLVDLMMRAARCFESPIERSFATAMAIHTSDAASRFPAFVVPDLDSIQEVRRLFRESDALSFLAPQVQIEDMRVDFLSVYWSHGRQALLTAIECDGHDFHERTADQAKRDRGRDRRLQQLGYRVFRFTGSEIWADALRCAAQVAQLIASETAARPEAAPPATA